MLFSQERPKNGHLENEGNAIFNQHINKYQSHNLLSNSASQPREFLFFCFLPSSYKFQRRFGGKNRDQDVVLTPYKARTAPNNNFFRTKYNDSKVGFFSLKSEKGKNEGKKFHVF